MHIRMRGTNCCTKPGTGRKGSNLEDKGKLADCTFQVASDSDPLHTVICRRHRHGRRGLDCLNDSQNSKQNIYIFFMVLVKSRLAGKITNKKEAWQIEGGMRAVTVMIWEIVLQIDSSHLSDLITHCNVQQRTCCFPIHPSQCLKRTIFPLKENEQCQYNLLLLLLLLLWPSFLFLWHFACFSFSTITLSTLNSL